MAAHRGHAGRSVVQMLSQPLYMYRSMVRLNDQHQRSFSPSADRLGAGRRPFAGPAEIEEGSCFQMPANYVLAREELDETRGVERKGKAKGLEREGSVMKGERRCRVI